MQTLAARLALALTVLLAPVALGCARGENRPGEETAATEEVASDESDTMAGADDTTSGDVSTDSSEPDSLPTPRLTADDLDVYLRGKRVENPEYAKRCKEFVEQTKSATATTIGAATTMEKAAAMSEEEMNKVGARAAGVDVRRYKAIADAVDRVLFLWADYVSNKDTLRLSSKARDSLRAELTASESTLGETATHNARTVLGRSGELYPVFKDSRGATLGMGCLAGK